MKYLILVGLLVSCGKMKIETKGIPKSIETKSEVILNDGYIALHKFCEDKYGTGTEDSEKCIEDGVNYKDVDVRIGLDDSLVDYCENREEPDSCLDDLSGFFDEYSDEENN
ncbi:MAG: hypothetical protein R3321_08830 [Nitrososphaeraceae archaeon]|nr:hypothetical protein [Nitrososphaeraceae archaeon]